MYILGIRSAEYCAKMIKKQKQKQKQTNKQAKTRQKKTTM